VAPSRPGPSPSSPYYKQTLEALGKHYGFKLSTAGTTCRQVGRMPSCAAPAGRDQFVYDDGLRSYKTSKTFEGVIPNHRAPLEGNRQRLGARGNRALHVNRPCGLRRLPPQARGPRGQDRRLPHRRGYRLSIREALDWFDELPATAVNDQQNRDRPRILKEIRERLKFLNDVGLEYLTLSRNSGTLSGGESQRIRLASQIGSGLTGVLYVLDEPSIGLHQRDNDRLLETLKPPARPSATP
jgi:excinuclease ABC subunit A